MVIFTRRKLVREGGVIPPPSSYFFFLFFFSHFYFHLLAFSRDHLKGSEDKTCSKSRAYGEFSKDANSIKQPQFNYDFRIYVYPASLLCLKCEKALVLLWWYQGAFGHIYMVDTTLHFRMSY